MKSKKAKPDLLALFDLSERLDYLGGSMETIFCNIDWGTVQKSDRAVFFDVLTLLVNGSSRKLRANIIARIDGERRTLEDSEAEMKREADEAAREAAIEKEYQAAITGIAKVLGCDAEEAYRVLASRKPAQETRAA